MPASRSACPVVGGNVSLYNEGGGGPIYPTRSSAWSARCPIRARCRGSASPRRATRSRSSARSRRARPARSSTSCAGGWPTSLPAVDLEAQARGARRGARRRCAPARWPRVHDVAEGGLAVALAECCIAGGLGAGVEPRTRPTRRCSARAPAGSSSPGRPRRVDGGAGRARDRHRRRRCAGARRRAGGRGRGAGDAYEGAIRRRSPDRLTAVAGTLRERDRLRRRSGCPPMTS